jgi:hypothetical protein
LLLDRWRTRRQEKLNVVRRAPELSVMATMGHFFLTISVRSSTTFVFLGAIVELVVRYLAFTGKRV